MPRSKTSTHLDTGRMTSLVSKEVIKIASGVMSPETRYKIKCGKIPKVKPLKFNTVPALKPGETPPTLADVAQDPTKLDAFIAALP